jgi:MraZ protein
LLEYAGISKEVVLFGYADKIEIWSKEAYEKMMNEEQDFAALAEDVMGKLEEDKGE